MQAQRLFAILILTLAVLACNLTAPSTSTAPAAGETPAPTQSPASPPAPGGATMPATGRTFYVPTVAGLMLDEVVMALQGNRKRGGV